MHGDEAFSAFIVMELGAMCNDLKRCMGAVAGTPEYQLCAQWAIKMMRSLSEDYDKQHSRRLLATAMLAFTSLARQVRSSARLLNTLHWSVSVLHSQADAEAMMRKVEREEAKPPDKGQISRALLRFDTVWMLVQRLMHRKVASMPAPPYLSGTVRWGAWDSSPQFGRHLGGGVGI